MRLLIVAAIIAVASAARLENLERGYLTPGNNFGNNGFGSNVGSFGNGFNSGSNDLGNGVNGLTNGMGTNGKSPSFTNGFGTNDRGSNGNGQSSTTFGSNGNGQSSTTFGSNENGGSQATNGFGSFGGTNGFAGAATNQYLPPDQSSSGSGGTFTFGGSSNKPACTSCGQSRFFQQYKQASSSVPGTSYEVQQFGSSLGSNDGSNLGSNFGSTSTGSTFGSSELSESNSGSNFGSPNGNFGSNSFGSSSFGSQGFSGSQGGANRQYLPPRPVSQNPPQQPFDEKYGYIY